jgi:uncharacterized protein DUF5996
MMQQSGNSRSGIWPDLPYEAWRDTCMTLHLWMQIVGKIRLAQTPWINHSWHATSYLTARGLTTSPIPYEDRCFQIDFDFIDHALVIQASDGATRRLALVAQPVAEFHSSVLAALANLGLHIQIHGAPNEIPDAIPFAQDLTHGAYDAEYAQRFWRVLVQVDRVFKRFRTGYLGKASPVHFFWGSFDLAVTRFSGRRAPQHPGGVPHLPDAVTREAYSHEVSSAGFWPGGGGIDYPAFYSYAYPMPAGYALAPVRPQAAFFHDALGEFILPYEAVRTADTPEGMLMTFLQSSYEAAAETGHWDRAALECPIGLPGKPRAEV